MPLWELFARYQRSEKALVLALQEAYLQGVSTRKVKKLTEPLCGTTVSKSFVSQVCQALDADIDAWRTRPRETIIPEVALLERRATLADERIAEYGDLTDAGENPRQQVVPLKYLPGDTETLARFLQTRPKRPHAPTLPGRFSWTIQRPL